jgi:hypothetical protein
LAGHRGHPGLGPQGPCEVLNLSVTADILRDERCATRSPATRFAATSCGDNASSGVPENRGVPSSSLGLAMGEVPCNTASFLSAVVWRWGDVLPTNWPRRWRSRLDFGADRAGPTVRVRVCRAFGSWLGSSSADMPPTDRGVPSSNSDVRIGSGRPQGSALQGGCGFAQTGDAEALNTLGRVACSSFFVLVSCGEHEVGLFDWVFRRRGRPVWRRCCWLAGCPPLPVVDSGAAGHRRAERGQHDGVPDVRRTAMDPRKVPIQNP